MGGSACGAAVDVDVVLIAFSISDQTEMKLPPAARLYSRCFMVCAALNSTPFTHWHLADTHILIPRCHAAKYWKATRNIKSTYLLSARQWHCTGGREREEERDGERLGEKKVSGDVSVSIETSIKVDLWPHVLVTGAFQKTVEGEKHLSSTQHANHQASDRFTRAIWLIISLLLVLNSA